MNATISRRKLLKGSLLVSGSFLTGLRRFPAQISPRPKPAALEPEESFRGGRKIGTVEFTQEAPVPMGQAFGSELDRRLYTDLSQLAPPTKIIPTDHFYIRTGASHLLPDANLASIKIGGLVTPPSDLRITELFQRAKPMGAHLMECAGNARTVHFGMMSAADWTGVPISDIIENAKPKQSAPRILISGFDRYANPSQTSVPGASWVFTIKELTAANAFLAAAMNGEPLTSDHGAPVRLIVPGWYGCACIKWVNEITFVGDDAWATSQMQEYAARTLQNGIPQLARDYEPATVDQAAMPIRIEKWIVNQKIRYRVIGILWGGSQPVRALEIRFNPEEDYVSVDRFEHTVSDPWAFWSHAWSPHQAGTYMIRLRVKEPTVRARKLDSGYYVRSVEIMDI